MRVNEQVVERLEKVIDTLRDKRQSSFKSLVLYCTN